MEIQSGFRRGFEKVMDPVLRVAARACEHSAILLEILRHVGFRGKGLIVHRIRHAAIPKRLIAECSGVKLDLDTDDDIQFDIYFNAYERRVLNRVLPLVGQGGTCLDLGANVGVFALHFARRVGPSGTVHAFEPDPVNYERLRRNIELNRFEGTVRAHQVALSDKTGSATFFCSSPGRSGWGSLNEFPDVSVGQITVPTTTLDDFVRDEKIEKVDFLKVDVEASEYEVLSGSRGCLERRLFKYILIEFNGIRLSELGKDFHGFRQFFAANGYVPARMNLRVFRRLQQNRIRTENTITNFLFTRG
jgi:FkbM family methyltransferase